MEHRTPARLRQTSLVVVAGAGISTGLVAGTGFSVVADRPTLAVVVWVLGLFEIATLFLVAWVLRVVADTVERGNPTYSQVLNRMEDRLMQLEARGRTGTSASTGEAERAPVPSSTT